MKNILLVLALLAGFGILNTSCNKDDDANPPSTTELLTDKCWKLANAIDACDEDDTEYFNADGTYLSDLGAVLCDPTDENTSGTWELSSDEKTLSVTVSDGGFSFTIDFTIDAISETSLTLSLTGFGSAIYVRC
jgi:hypothetical protein